MLPALEEDRALTVEDYLCDWLAHSRTRVRPTTYKGYQALIRHHVLPHLGRLQLAELRPLHIQHMYGALLAGGNGKALSAGTVLNTHPVLTQALSQAVRWGLIVANPAKEAQPPRPRRPEPQVVDGALASRILEAASGSPIECAVALALSTGMRRGEILALRWSDVDMGSASLRVRRSLQPTASGLVFAEPKTRRARGSRGSLR
jgi:integrase